MILDYFGETMGSKCQQCSSASCKTDWDACVDFESKVIELLKKATAFNSGAQAKVVF